MLDPFMGTGTTILAAQLEGASGIGIELDPSYLAVAHQRLAGTADDLFAGGVRHGATESAEPG